MTTTFQRARKYDSYLRMGLAGAAGSGKTYTALLLAHGLCRDKRVAVIDTEHGSAAKVADRWDFDAISLETYPVKAFVDAIKTAEAEGYGALVIDSLSHAWTGTGGVLDEKDRIAKSKYGGNSFAAWNDAGALQNQLIDAILKSKIHIIATLRSKMDYVLERDEKSGRSSPRKVGLAPIQRDDLPYEFDIFAHLEQDHTLVVEKSRCSALVGAVIPNPGDELAQTIHDWLRGEKPPGAPPPSPLETVTAGMSELARRAGVEPRVIRDRCLMELDIAVGPVSTLMPEELEMAAAWVEAALNRG
ncbi:MAG: ATP-binding protein [Acidobacteria bacterium]|nr:ATP-binding protein [Acidobacteriota bacterium]